jgi:hypothetical protein
MSFYTEFLPLFPYLQSIRKLKDYLSFDVRFPTTWKIPKKYVDEDKVLEQQNTDSSHRIFSFVGEINEQSLEIISNNIINIVKYNLEREEKEKLFQAKVEELKSVFDKQNLKSLHNLKFEINNNTIELTDDETQFENN